MLGTVVGIGIIVCLALGSFFMMAFVMIRRPGTKDMYKQKFTKESPDTTDEEFEEFWKFCHRFWLGGALLFALIAIILLIVGLGGLST